MTEGELEAAMRKFGSGMKGRNALMTYCRDAGIKDIEGKSEVDLLREIYAAPEVDPFTGQHQDDIDGITLWQRIKQFWSGLW